MDWSGLIEKAMEGMERAYAPYSGFRVGAALLGKSGEVYTGCNVESCAYTPTCCAERTALVKAVSEGERAFSALAVVSVGGVDEDYTSPCGVCRQMLFEFCEEDMPVILAKSKEDYKQVTLGQLLPMGFGPDKLITSAMVPPFYSSKALPIPAPSQVVSNVILMFWRAYSMPCSIIPRTLPACNGRMRNCRVFFAKKESFVFFANSWRTCSRH